MALDSLKKRIDDEYIINLIDKININENQKNSLFSINIYINFQYKILLYNVIAYLC